MCAIVQVYRCLCEAGSSHGASAQPYHSCEKCFICKEKILALHPRDKCISNIDAGNIRDEILLVIMKILARHC